MTNEMTHEPGSPNDGVRAEVPHLSRLVPGDQPTPCPKVAAYPVDGELVLYDSRDGQGLVLNSTAAQIWTMCDGSRSIAAIAELMAATHALAYEEALTDVCECVEHLRRAGVLIG